MDFIVFVNPGTAHAPYPGTKVTAADEAAAVVAAAALLGVTGGTKFFVVALSAFTEHCYSVGPVSAVAPTYA